MAVDIPRHIRGATGLILRIKVEEIVGTAEVRENIRGARHMRYAMVKMVN